MEEVKDNDWLVCLDGFLWQSKENYFGWKQLHNLDALSLKGNSSGASKDLWSLRISSFDSKVALKVGGS